ncbi:cation:proton antiporter [Desulfatitalea tepidiphila]|uniref:cation:proton antiporter n=1 Tax=Desulfatitalea tepidiphila TaxID=1185843 RepID=UPI0006B52AF9|nr:cation:proton antiporter [Desulfatitalea tepidiphila]
MDNVPFLLLAGLILCVFFAVSFASQKLRLPSVLVYIILGVGVSSRFVDSSAIHTVAEIGIVILFFILGMEFPLGRMVAISKKIWPSGLMDVVLNLGGATALAWLFGLAFPAALVIGSVAYATSSSISAKMLQEQKRLANPEAEFILAILIFEDLVAPILVSFIAAMGQGETLSPHFGALLLFKIVLLAAGAIFLGHFGFKRLNDFVIRHLQKDFMTLMTAGVALSYAGLAIALGLSEILGAFLAGMMLSETGRSTELEHLVLPIRDITLPFFFFWFGTTISLGEGIPLMPLLVALIVWAAIGKIITGYAGGRLYGLSPKVSIRASFSLIHRGEFSAIIASLAAPQLKLLSGIYILVTAFMGVYLFQKAPTLANWYHERWCRKCEAES